MIPRTLRSALAALTFLLTAVASIATSPVVSPPVGLELEQTGDAVLNAAQPRVTKRYLATLSAEANAPGPDGGAPLTATLRVSWDGFVMPGYVQVDGGVSDAGRPPPDAGDELFFVRIGDAGTSSSPTSMALFVGCPVGTACTEAVDLDLSLAPGDERSVSASWVFNGAVTGGALNPNPPGASFTLIER
ncbi:MAG: hypothetical protein Q8L48_00305 [Archangium sp.]|nr:hypothetical protein [Archangium sp.]